MKKSLSLVLALVFVLGIAATAFAANPFVDVPAKHWSYNAVSQLAKAGIVDGYDDGTFRGDKTMTRYEMAQIVAKAMAKEDKADAANKALIEKLAAEYSAELQNLGVRVSNLEKNQPNLKITGTVDVRYSNKDFTSDGPNADLGTSADWRVRLNASAKIDDNSTFNLRIVNNATEQNAGNKYGLAQNKSWAKFGSGETFGADIDRVWISTKLGVVNTNIGRQVIQAGNTGMITDPGIASFDGVNFKYKMGAVNTSFSYGRLPGTTELVTNIPTSTSTQKDVTALELSTTMGKLGTAAGYLGVKDNASNAARDEILKVWYANAKYTFDPKFSINAEFAKNNADYADTDNKAWTVWATYGAQALKKAHDQNFQVRYYKVDKYALGMDTGCNYWGTLSEGVKFGGTFPTFTSDNIHTTQFYYNYAFSSNLTGQIGYYMGRSSSYDQGDYNMWRYVLSAKF